MIRIEIPGEPVAWARARQSGKRHFTPQKQRSSMDAIAWEAFRIMNGRPLLSGPLSVRAKFVFSRPKSHTKKQRAAPNGHFKATKPDSSNLLKLVEDALNNVVWTDDAQVALALIEKQWGQTPATYIVIEALNMTGEGGDNGDNQ